jgi:hypothetical protein
MVREPGRIGLQVAPERFRSLTDADVARMHSQAESAAAAAALANAPAAAAPPPVELPQTDCVLIVNFTSESAARKLRARLSESGISDPIAVESQDQKSRLRVNKVNAATEERIHQLLKEFPKLALEHCLGAQIAH